jgi:hypothetical protein
MMSSRRNLILCGLLVVCLFAFADAREREDEFKYDFGDLPVELLLTRDAFLQRQQMRDQQSGGMNRTQSGSGGDGSASSPTNSSSFDKRQTNPRLIFRGGPVMTNAVIKSIFWGSKWAYSAFHQDKLDAVDSFFSGMSGSRYLATGSEYTGSNGRVTTTSSYQGRWVDTSDSSAVAAGGNTQFNALVNKACSIMTNQWNTLDPNGNSFVAMFTDIPRPAGMGYCAWHSYAYCGSRRFQFAFHWNLDGDGGCAANDGLNLHGAGASNIINVAGHELLEAVTDPLLNAWTDANGSENADKCAWKFPAPYITLSNGARFKVQAEWSNNAYNSGSGYSDASGYKGCVSGA